MVRQADDPGGVRHKTNAPRSLVIAAPVAGLEGREAALSGTVSWRSLGLPCRMRPLVDRPGAPAHDWMVS